jgi:glycerol-3-phosphate dehydrogenase
LTQIEVDYLVREEWARSVEDIYWRHSKTGLHASPAEQQRLAAYLQKTGNTGQARPAQATP